MSSFSYGASYHRMYNQNRQEQYLDKRVCKMINEYEKNSETLS